MTKFPNKEADVVALADQMIAGYTLHPADFPSIDPLTTLVALQAALDDYQADKQTQADTRASASLATETKDTTLVDLAEVMKNDLKLSEVDVADDPSKLEYIGWGSKAEPQPLTAPGQPDDFTPTIQGQGTVWFVWTKPVSGGKPANYIIQRRDTNPDSSMGPWQLINTTFNAEIHLLEQPRGIEMEYRVIAANAAGESLPSNTASVVL